MKSLSQSLSKLGHRPSQSGFAPSSANKSKWHKDSFDFLEFINRWQSIVGENLAQHTVPLKLRQGTLTVLTDHSAFAQQLSLLEQVLIKKIVTSFPALQTKVKKLSFQVNARYFQEQSKEIENKKEKEVARIHPHSPLFKKWKQEASELLDDVEDEELKNSLKSIFLQLREQQYGDS